MTTKQELLPCPFCGSNDIDTEGPCYTEFMCNDCGASIYDQASHAEAIAAWNTRAPLATPSTRCAETIDMFTGEVG